MENDNSLFAIKLLRCRRNFTADYVSAESGHAETAAPKSRVPYCCFSLFIALNLIIDRNCKFKYSILKFNHKHDQILEAEFLTKHLNFVQNI